MSSSDRSIDSFESEISSSQSGSSASSSGCSYNYGSTSCESCGGTGSGDNSTSSHGSLSQNITTSSYNGSKRSSSSNSTHGIAIDAKLAALFNLPVVCPPLCDEDSCEFIAEYIFDFAKHLEGGHTSKWIVESELDALRHSVNVLKATVPHEKIDWMPDYGCALLKNKAGCNPGEITLNLISLDLHCFQTKSKLSSDDYSYSYIDSAIAKDYEILHVGTCGMNELNDIQCKFRDLLKSAQRKTGNSRSARGGKQGHQRTPAFVHALYREALGSPNQVPRGGMTDVGLHTGDVQKRDTSPPLVFYTLSQALHDYEAECGPTFSPDALFKKTVIYLGLYTIDSILLQYEQTKLVGLDTNAPHVLLEHAMFILRSTSIKAASFSDGGLGLAFFAERSKSLQEEIMRQASIMSESYSSRYCLPAGASAHTDIMGKYTMSKFDIPAQTSPAMDSTLSQTDITRNESRNLNWFAICQRKSLQDTFNWVEKTKTSGDSIPSILVLRTVEMLMWEYAKKLPTMKEHDIELVTSIVDSYREVLHHFTKSEKYKPLSLVELRSRELLVVWVAFCIIHFNAGKFYETVEEFGVPIDFNDLSHLVLSSPDEWEVALQVAKYLSKFGTARPIFSLRDEQPTFDMGREIAHASPRMVKIWMREKKDAMLRVEGHWEEILRKKELANDLREEISDLTREKERANRQLTSAETELKEHEKIRYSAYSGRNDFDNKRYSVCRSSVQKLSRTVCDLESEISSTENILASTLRAPPPVHQPLPLEKRNAMPIIFFMYMPRIFQILSRFSFTSQQLRISKPWEAMWAGHEGSEVLDVSKQIIRGEEICQFSWTEYYNNHQHSQYHTPTHSRSGSDYYLLLRSVSNNVPEEVGPKNIDRIGSKSDGIWYPDQLKPRMAWFGGTKSFDQASGNEINPFAEIDHFCLVANFTERLTEDSTLQWALMQPGEAHILPSRANLPYARQNLKPAWLSTTQYLSFTNMRSYPNIQIRNILVAVQERQLPLTDNAVHILIRQTLFHIGKISGIHAHPKLEWKRDLEEQTFSRDAHKILESFYEEIKDSPKKYTCVKLVGMLFNVFSHWEPKSRQTARKLSASVCEWADSIGKEIEKSPPSLTPSIRAKQVVLYQQAILTLAGGSLIKDDVALLLKLLVKCRNYFTCGEKANEIQRNATEITYDLCKKMDDILKHASSSPSMLTDAFCSVFQRCPRSLRWINLWTPGLINCTQCFRAKEDGHCYYIDLISGEVLIDGLPPSSLPLSIRNNKLYKRTFGERNFEVVEKGAFLETCHSIFGRFYKFSKSSSLKIFEFKSDQSEMLELLDVTSGKVGWAGNLPERLKVMHSHWFFRSENLIAIRGVSFKDRRISFFVQVDAAMGSLVRCVELHSQSNELPDLAEHLGTMDMLLVLHKSRALDIISKFEPREYIHSIFSPAAGCGTSVMKFFLPRYKLTFTLVKGVLHCQEIVGYQLASKQQTNQTLRGINMYLMLEATRGKGRLIIFPKGPVIKHSWGNIKIDVSNKCDEQLLWYQYEFHPRFGYIEAKQSRESRMQLVALHIATNTILCDELLGMTGEERAISLIRQCWGNCPLNKNECLLLDNIKQLARGLSPALSVLCRDVEISSQQLNFLYPSKVSHTHVNTESFEITAYLNNVKNNQISRRCFLSPREEYRVIGKCSIKPALPHLYTPSQSLPMKKCPVTEKKMISLQTRLNQIRLNGFSEHTKPALQNRPFPIVSNTSSKLEMDMMDELKKSWNAHMNSSPCCTANVEVTPKGLACIQTDIAWLRQQAEDFALDALSQRSETISHAILRIVGIVPTATTADLAKIAIDPSIISDFNTMLAKKSRKAKRYRRILLECILFWLRLCVYEDKMARLISFSNSGLAEDVWKELGTMTVWEAATHPYWLVFEVENAITIRQDQYKVAQHLINNPGDIIQLNMGLGKTRVILPMLVLYHSFQKEGKKVARLHILSALFEEAYKYLTNHLCASILGIKIYRMPFCRDFNLDSLSVTAMKNAMKGCHAEGGALIVAPEHRLSIELKAKELHWKGERDVASQIEHEIIRQDIWHDILDECDELLRHRYQLIYAIGDSVQLPDGGHRWRAIQAILTTLAHNDALRKHLCLHPKTCKIAQKSAGEWPEIQFYDGKSLDIMLGGGTGSQPIGLVPMIASAIMTNPPHELKWLVDHPLKEDITKVIIEKDYAPVLEELPEYQLADILALRGFLAGSVLRHCLLKRHRVDFGIARPGKKRLAVPFRFADTPDPRSEFAHPDCAIAFTVLAYYADGLSKSELMQSLENLMSLDENAQHHFYNTWFAASSDQIQTKAQNPDFLDSLNCIKKIDTTNKYQMENMWAFYRHNMYTINFYLNMCVFPNEMNQYDSRLTATSWNLAQSPSNNIVGFSGTNDNHRILPLQVQQYFASKSKKSDPTLKELDGTNGKMLEMIIKHTIEVKKIEAEVQPYQSLIGIICNGWNGSIQQIHAVIDSGALLAGGDLQGFSNSILTGLPIEEFDGALFYDDAVSHDWVILERSGRLLPKEISPVKEDRAFVVFDEPRCRGTDLKLRSDTVALLTLAPKLCKDKLMQAAGRLRKLGKNQKLIMVGGSNVFTKLSDFKATPFPQMNDGFGATPMQVLSWAMKNTVESTAAGLSNWANQGLFFATTIDKDPQFSITEEVIELNDMYGKSFLEQTVINMNKKSVAYHLKRTGGTEEQLSRGILASIVKRVNEYGSDFTFLSGGYDEECERELELEIEEEEEIEVEIPLVQPRKEKKWDFERVLLCQSPSELPTSTFLLPAFIRRLLQPLSLAEINWSKKIYCTRNFALTIVRQTGELSSALNHYLRVVNFVLCFPSGNFLLVSEFEANSLIGLFWNSKRLGDGISYNLLHSSLLRQSLDCSHEILLQNNLFSRRPKAGNLIDESSMASLQLFAGECNYATEKRKEALKMILRGQKRKSANRMIKSSQTFCPLTEAKRMAEMRGRGHMFLYSNLETLCEELLCEL